MHLIAGPKNPKWRPICFLHLFDKVIHPVQMANTFDFHIICFLGTWDFVLQYLEWPLGQMAVWYLILRLRFEILDTGRMMVLCTGTLLFVR